MESIKKILRNHLEENGEKTGFMPIDAPTGIGKSHQSLDYMAESLIKGSDQHFCFITPLKKNLPVKKLGRILKDLGHEELFDENVLMLKPNADMLYDSLSQDLDIPEWIYELEWTDGSSICSFADVQNAFETVRKNREDRNRDVSDTEEDYEKFTQLERKFRRAIKGTLKKELSREYFLEKEQIQEMSQEEVERRRLEAIRSDPKWNIIAKFYPSVLKDDKKVLFLSTKKALLDFDPIVSYASPFFTTKAFTDSVVFIDEVDSCKEEFNDIIAEESVRNQFDQILAFQTVSHVLTDIKPRLFFGDESFRKIEDRQKKLAKEAQELIDKYKANHDFKLVYESDKEIYREFIFSSIVSTSLIGTEIVLDYNDSMRKTQMKRIPQKKSDSQLAQMTEAERKEWNGEYERLKGLPKLRDMLRELRRFFSMFVSFIRDSANWISCEGEISFQEAVYSILRTFRIRDDSPAFRAIANRITNTTFRTHNKDIDKTNILDDSFYNRGFSFYPLQDSSSHALQTEISEARIYRTAEKILIQMCSETIVVGLSATASVDSKIGNFDIEYLKLALGSAFRRLTDEERRWIREEHALINRGYKNIDIQVLPVSGDLQGSFLDPNPCKLARLGRELIEANRQVEGRSQTGFYKERYAKMERIFRYFMDHDAEIDSFLCLLNSFPSEAPNASLNLQALKTLYKGIAQEKGLADRFDPDSDIFVVSSARFEENMRCVKDRLKQGGKVFLISTYATMSAGQNIQYTYPDQMESRLLNIHERSGKKKKDFDGVYVDMPTHLMDIDSQENDGGQSFILACIRILTIFYAGEISTQQMKDAIKNAVANHMSSGKEKTPSYGIKRTLLPSVMSYALIRVLQAIGRINRTGIKRSKVHILFDNDMHKFINPSTVNGLLLTPESEAFVQKLRENNQAEIDEVSNYNRKQAVSWRMTDGFIKRYTRFGHIWTENAVAQWNALRELVLKAPSFTEESRERLKEENRDINFDYATSIQYLKVPEKTDHYYYRTLKDFDDVEVSMREIFDKEKTAYKGPFEVSMREARLDKLMAVRPDIRKYFEDKGYAVKIEPGNYILNPILFRNIYLGALGEVVGEYLLKKLGVETEPLPVEHTEKFDARVKGTNFYIDYKYWKGPRGIEQEENFDWIQKKAEAVGAEKVLILNILAENESYKIVREKRGIVEITTIPYLIHSEDGKISSEAREAIKEFCK